MKKDEATNGLRDLRGTLEWLKSKELLLETDVEVNGDLEITGLQKHLDGSIPMLFQNVKGYPHLRAVTNLFGNIAVMNEMFGWAITPTVQRLWHRRLRIQYLRLR